MEYKKPPLTFEQQADLLISRGLIADRDELIYYLNHVSYYRLSAYLYPYRNSDDTYKTGITFQQVWRHYTFDRQLRIITIDAIERIEVAIRTQLVTKFTLKYNPFGYTIKKNLPSIDSNEFNKWLQEIQEDSKKSHEAFSEHFRSTYGDVHTDMPLWMIVEIMSFGKMLTFFKGVDYIIRRDIADYYGIADIVLESWLLSLNIVRNICAHHGRLWNRVFRIKPMIPKIQKHPLWHTPCSFDNDRVFAVLTIMRYFLKLIAPRSQWHQRLKKLFQDYPEISLASMGFPEKWEEHEIWKEGDSI